MAQDYSKHQQKIIGNYYAHRDTIRFQKLSELVTEIWLAEGGPKAAKLWERAGKELLGAGVDAGLVARVVKEQDPSALAEMVKKLDAGAKAGGAAPAAAAASTPTQAPSPAAGPSEDPEAQLKRALGAFKKKLKNMRLDDESALGGRYTTKGQVSSITAITPPREFPDAVWKELVRLGRLKAAGQGMYQLP